MVPVEARVWRGVRSPGGDGSGLAQISAGAARVAPAERIDRHMETDITIADRGGPFPTITLCVLAGLTTQITIDLTPREARDLAGDLIENAALALTRDHDDDDDDESPSLVLGVA